jgi:leucine dehydrogenase
METKYVSGLSETIGGSGDPSPVTALGVYVGMKASIKELTGSDSLSGKSVVVQGVGHVGQYICGHLHKEGAKIYVSDIFEDNIKEMVNKYKVEVVNPPDKVYDIAADIFCPAALGAVINDDTVNKLKFKIIAGAANNILLDEKKHGQMLFDKGILYAPDYVINAGGVINVYYELEGYHRDRALRHAEGIYDTLISIFATSKKDKIPTYIASNKLAEERLAEVGHIKKKYVGGSKFSGRFSELFK